MPVPLIDHVIVNARDKLDAAAERYAQLGFTLTPRGHHTLGSINNLAVLGTDYIELLGVPPGEDRTDVLDWPAGLNGLVFKTTDSDALHTELAASGAPVLPPQQFSRPVDVAGGKRDAAFRTVRLARDAVQAGRMFFCQHLTSELVWQEERPPHANGAVGLLGMLIGAEDPATLCELFARMFGRAAVRRTAAGCNLVAGLATIEVMAPTALVAGLGSAMPDPGGRREFMAALVLRTISLEQVWAEVPEAVRFEHGLLVPANAACGAALIFRE
ncbi:MAG: VOC family protein [Acetobacteraceae bacterium]|nr:VOC family protein [Acetobacteraceae bacterium]